MTTLRLLFLNAYLLRPLSLGWRSRRWEPWAAPAVAARAHEIGPAVAGQYDVAALAEVFSPADRDRVLAAWPDATWATGPPGGWRDGWTVASSGLLTVVEGPSIVRWERHRYRHGGHRLWDADPWAAKGVLLVEVDLGLPGRVEVYSTHLCAGGELFPGVGNRVAATEPVRQAQVAELVAFVARTHRPGNLAVVVGDMNVPDACVFADDALAPGRALLDAFAAAGFDDLWSTAGRGSGFTCSLQTHADVVGVLDPADPRFADDGPGPPGVVPDPPAVIPNGGRIDRVFLQRPAPEHALAVTGARVARRPFPRALPAPGRRRLAHLSDHLGLHVELDLAPTGP